MEGNSEGEVFEPKPEEPKPFQGEDKKPVQKRVKGDDFLSYVAVGAGTLLVTKRIDPPVGRTLQLEAPLIGQQIDKVIAGTFLDKLLQPLFSKGEMLEELAAVLTLPILIGTLERKPEWAPLLMEPIAQSLTKVLEETAPLIRKKNTATRRTAKTMTDLGDAFDIPRGADPVDTILRGFIFQDIPQPEPEPEPVS
jgi:hypothetical protein